MTAEKKKVDAYTSRDGWITLHIHLGSCEYPTIYKSREMSIGEARKLAKELERVCAQAEKNRKENYEQVIA